MQTRFRKSLLSCVVASLLAAPGWLAAQQSQYPQSGSERYGQPMGSSPAPAGEPGRSYPGAGMAVDPAEHSAATGNQGDASLASVSDLTLQQLEKMDVVDSAGEKIGKVDELVRSRSDGLIYAVITSGGVLGIGADKIPVPLQDLQRQADTLHLGIARDALQKWPKYQDDQYVELKPSNQPISDFAAFEPTPPEESGNTPDSAPSR